VFAQLTSRLIRIGLVLLLVIVVGTAGYRLIEHESGWSVLDALYMTVITLASVGFGEVHPLSPAGRVFTIFLILGGTGVLVYGISTLTAFIVEGELTSVLRRRKMQRGIDKLTDHFIVCGADNTGRYAIDELAKTRQHFVVIDRNPERLKELEARGILTLHGDATHDTVLLAAGIARARGLISALHSDADNLFVTLTAKGLNARLRVISKAVEEASEAKLRRAGADGVVMPNYIGGLRLASELIRPAVVTFLDRMVRTPDATIRVSPIEIAPHSPLNGQTLAESGLLERDGITVVALLGADGVYHFNPTRDTRLSPKHTVIVIGEIAVVNALNGVAEPV
jgi:voltage-gated potassium channel